MSFDQSSLNEQICLILNLADHIHKLPISGNEVKGNLA